jgi:RNA polymerase sigma factor (sigma-70 family)
MAAKANPKQPEGSDSYVNLIINSNTWNRSLPVTVWDRLEKANRDSLEYFARRYATPIYCYYRKHNLPREDAKDLTMKFILEKVVQGSLLKGYRLGQYRFRDYLLRALINFLIDYVRYRDHRKALELERLLQADPGTEPAAMGTPERNFIRDCTHDQLRAVLVRVRSECERDGLGQHFEVFCLRHFDEPQLTWDEIGQRFGIPWQEAKNKAWTIKERLRRAMLDEFKIADMTESQAKKEILGLIAMFPGSSGRDFCLAEEDE